MNQIKQHLNNLLSHVNVVTTAVVVAGSIISISCLYLLRGRTINSSTNVNTRKNSYSAMKGNIKISKLYIYPIKACKGIEVNTLIIHPHGIENDRVYAIAMLRNDGKWHVLGMNSEPRFCLIKPRLIEKGLILSAPNMNNIQVPLITDEKSIINVCKNGVGANYVVPCYDQGEMVAQWINQYTVNLVDHMHIST